MAELTELIDVLDEKGRKTNYKCTLSEAHSNGFWHHTCHIWFYDNTGNIILQRRAKDSGTYSNLLDISSAGHIFSESNEIETAEKEIFEELGLKIDCDCLKKVCTIKSVKIIPELQKEDKEFNTIFLYKLNDLNIDFKLQKEELDCIDIKPLNQFESEIIDPKKSKEYVDHGLDYYSKIITEIKRSIKKNK